MYLRRCVHFNPAEHHVLIETLFCLQPLVIGKRRAAQRMMGAAQVKLKALDKPDISPAEVTRILKDELEHLAQA